MGSQVALESVLLSKGKDGLDLAVSQGGQCLAQGLTRKDGTDTPESPQSQDGLLLSRISEAWRLGGTRFLGNSHTETYVELSVVFKCDSMRTQVVYQLLSPLPLDSLRPLTHTQNHHRSQNPFSMRWRAQKCSGDRRGPGQMLSPKVKVSREGTCSEKSVPAVWVGGN